MNLAIYCAAAVLGFWLGYDIGHRRGFLRGRMAQVREEIAAVVEQIERTQAVIDELEAGRVTPLGGVHARH